HGPRDGPGRSGHGGRLRRHRGHRHAGRDPEEPRRDPGLSGGGATGVTTTSAALERTTTTIAARIRDRAATMGSRTAMREKDLGIWREVTWESYWDTVLTVGHALLALGVEPGDRVAVHSENRREW